MDAGSFKRIAIHNVMLLMFWLTVNLRKSSGEKLYVDKVSQDPVFVGLGEPLKLKINIHHEEVDNWNVTAVWIFISNPSSDRNGEDLLLIRGIGSNNTYAYSWHPRATLQGEADLLLVNTTLNDSGKYKCMLRRPPRPWETSKEFSVTIQGGGVSVQKVSRETIYVATGETLKLDIILTNLDSYNRKLGAFWDFRAVSSSSQKHVLFIRNIGVKGGYVKRYDPRALVEEKGSLLLANVTSSDSGTFYFRIIRPPSNGSIRADYHVIVDDKPRAKITCANVIRLAGGEHFTCWCKAIRIGRMVPQASWIKNGLIIRTPGLSPQQLSLNNFSKDMVGTYICRANVSTLRDEQKVKINMIRLEPQVQQCLKEPSEWYLMLISGCGGVLLGIVITFAIQYARGKKRNNRLEYDEPTNVMSFPEYQELDKKRVNDEHHYQSLRPAPKKANKC